MEFRILGPLEVVNGGGVVPVGGIKPRAVLAVLVLHANEPVSAERLAHALWGEEAPTGAIKTVQVHVSRLRRALGDAEVLETTPAGYRLRVRPGELDVERFEGLADDGQRALAAGQAEQAAAVLRNALALWRGPPLADLAFEAFAQADIVRLEERRLSILEARVEADLAAGRHAALVGELQQLVRAHRARERFAGLLMLALYRCGRQADALDAYQMARRALVETFGVEPGPSLLWLHEAILHQDVSLEARPGVAELPRELDAATTNALVGRDAELGFVRERWLSARSGVGTLVTVLGTRGIGKTRLVAELAREAQQDEATVAYVAGRGPAEAVLASLARVRGVARPTLLVLDDVDKADVDVLAALQQLTPALATLPMLVLATAEDAQALACLGDGVLHLEALDEEAVRTIAVGYAPRRAGADVPAEWLLDASGGIPARVHEVARQWARREAAGRVGAVAGRAAAGRVELRSMESELAGDVVALQAIRERGAPSGGDTALVVCPFKGLASFEVADAPYFFGRERLVAELVARLVGAPLLAIVGSSGSGKSSVLRAGLLPALAGGVLPGSEGWPQVIIRPGEHPLNELNDAASGLGDHRCVLAVDQFEETFTACRDEQERAAFIAGLAKIARAGNGGAIVVLAVRADYYGRCAAYPQLSSLLAPNQVLVGSMQRDDLRRVIEGPAQRVGLRIEPELVDALVADVEDQLGGLPLLSTALLELWQQHEGRHLRHAAYAHTGGVRGAVARLAEDAFTQLDETQQTVARSVMMRLVGLGAQGAVERRRVPLTEFATEQSENVARVLALFTDRRLLTVSTGTIEVAHEALIRHWPRLREWIDSDRAGLLIHRRLSDSAQQWENLNREPGSLYRGTRLATGLEWANDHDADLSPLERDFLTASQANEHSEAETARRRARRLRSLASGLAVLTVIVAALAVWALGQRNDAQRQRNDTQRQAAEATLVGLENSLISMENGIGRYVTTRDRAFLEAVNRALAAYPKQRDALAGLISDDRGQQERVRRIGGAIDDYAQFWVVSAIEIAQDDLQEARSQVETYGGRDRLDAIRRDFARLFERERVIRSREQRAESNSARAIGLSIGVLSLVLVVATVFTVYLRRSVVGRS